MRTPILIGLTILSLSLVPAVAQSTKHESSSKISDAAPTAIPDDEAFAAYQHVTKGMKPPKARLSPDPEYPKIPSDAEPNGIVVMLIGINTKGRVELVHVLRASNEAFQQSAVTTVKTWKFSPAKKDGKAVPAQVTVEIHFQK